MYCDTSHSFTQVPEENNCWLYDPNADSWSLYSTGSYGHNGFPGAAHENKIYMVGPSHQELFDPIANEWSLWPNPTESLGDYSCLLSWQDSLILLGGSTTPLVVERFQVSSQEWTTLDTNAPIEIYASGCAVLPNEEIMVLGSVHGADKHETYIYNVELNEWRHVGRSFYDRTLTALVVLGSRVFAVGGLEDDQIVEEYIFAANQWVTLEAKALVGRQKHVMISVPAELFAHLPGGCEGVM